MPHVAIKHFPKDLSEDARAELVAAITRAVTRAFDCDEGVVSVAVDSVDPARWREQVYLPEIERQRDRLAKVPNY